MKKIGVLSDTHLTGYDPHLESLVVKHFSDADLIIHAGDLVTMAALDPLHQLNGEVIAVCGNMDSAEVHRAFPPRRIIEVEGLTIGIIHGWGTPHGIRERIRGAFENVDAIVYGHSHQSYAATEGGTYYFNPGSPTDSRFTTCASIGIILVDKNTLRGEIIRL